MGVAMSKSVRGFRPSGKIEPGDPDFSVHWADLGDLDRLFREAKSRRLPHRCAAHAGLAAADPASLDRWNVGRSLDSG
jgi:hypothetical protein